MPTYPTLVDFYVLDPDNGDDEYSNGDVLHLNFDMDTNRPACGGGASNASGASGGGKALVDCLFDFSHSLGADYEGEWATAARFAITVIDATGASVSVTSPATRATVVSTDVRNARGDALTGHNSSATLRGEFGLIKPAVDRFTVVVAANASNYTDGDTWSSTSTWQPTSAPPSRARPPPPRDASRRRAPTRSTRQACRAPPRATSCS